MRRRDGGDALGGGQGLGAVAQRPSRFSDNAVTLLPGQEAEIVFAPADGDAAAVTPTARDLFSSFSPST